MQPSTRSSRTRSARVHSLLGHKQPPRIRRAMEILVLLSLFALIAIGLVLGNELLALLAL